MLTLYLCKKEGLGGVGVKEIRTVGLSDNLTCPGGFRRLPYDLNKELRVFNDTNKMIEKGELIEAQDNNRTSKLTFVISDRLGDIQEHLIKVDKSFEGKMLMFPAKLNHQVYPFYTSNGYRITVSGNINLDVTKIMKN